MKSIFNIAICFSGESRTFKEAAPFIQQFLKSDHNVKLFCHTWSANSWKVFEPGNSIAHSRHTQMLDDSVLRAELNELYTFEYLQIDEPLLTPKFIEIYGNDHVYLHCLSQFKSAALSNNLKTQYELTHNMTFDIVFKMRLDCIYERTQNIDCIVNKLQKPLCDEVIMNSHHSTNFEFRQAWANDMVYYGSSLGMDIVSDLYFYYSNGGFFKQAKYSIFDTALGHYGPNTLLYKWAIMKNLKISRNDCEILHGCYPLRPEVLPVSFPSDYERIRDYFLYGQNIIS